MTDNASLADKLGALDARFRNKTPPLKEWAQAVDDLLAFLCVNAPAIITALRADQRCAESEAENARLREVVRLYVDPYGVRPEHEAIVDDAT